MILPYSVEDPFFCPKCGDCMEDRGMGYLEGWDNEVEFHCENPKCDYGTKRTYQVELISEKPIT